MSGDSKLCNIQVNLTLQAYKYSKIIYIILESIGHGTMHLFAFITSKRAWFDHQVLKMGY